MSYAVSYAAPGAGYVPQRSMTHVDAAYRSAPTDKLALAAAIIGAANALVPVLGALAGIVVGIIALGRLGRNRTEGKYLAVAGIVVSAASLILGIVLTIEVVVLAIRVI